MPRTTMLPRSQTRIRFGNEDMDFVFQWLLGYQADGGAAFGELFRVAARIEDGDPDSWIAAFLGTGDRLRTAGDALRGGGKTLSAQRTALRAFTCYRAAAQMMNPPHDDRFAPTVAAFERCFAEAIPGFGHPCEPVRIPFEGSYLSGYFYRVDERTIRRPTLIMVGGADTYAEDLHFWAGAPGPRRGYNVLAVDLPGQGSSPARGLSFRPDAEVPMRAIVDDALARPEVDGERLAAFGISAGGYFVTRAVSHEHRIRAAIADTPIYDVFRAVTESIPAFLLDDAPGGLAAWLVNVAGRVNRVGRNNIDKYVWQAGKASLWEAIDLFRAAPVDVEAVRCPMLCLAGEGDPPEFIAQTKVVFDRLPHPRKAMRIFTAEEGAEAHCQVNNFPLLHQVVFDWLDDAVA